MKNIFKGLSLGLIALLLVVGVGAGSAGATSTYTVNAITETGALTITSAGALGLVAGANSIDVGSDLTAKTITIGAVTGASALALNSGSGGTVITSADDNSLAVGPNGTTTPIFKVDSSTGSAVAGLKLTGAVTGGTVALVATDSGSATNLTLNAKGTGTLGLATVSTGAITIGNSSAGLTTIYGGNTGNNNGIDLISALGTITTEAHAVDVAASGTLGTSGNLVGVNSVLTTAGSGGTWASAFYGQTVQTAAQHVSGYMSGGEFEVKNTFATAANEMFPLVLDANSNTYHPSSAYIWMQDFGSALIPNLFTITGATSASGNMFYVHAPTTLAASLKVLVGSTTYYLPLYTTQ